MKRSFKKEEPDVKKAVYAGSFDPATNGHLWILKEGARLFDELVVAVGINPDKEYTFSLKERVKVLKEISAHLSNVRVVSFKNNLVDYAKTIKASYILRGIRSQEDYEYEKEMRYVNSDLNPDITTVFLIPPKEISKVSSSKLKSLVGSENWQKAVKPYIPEATYSMLVKKFEG